MAGVAGGGEVVADQPAVTLGYLDHGVVAGLAGSSHGDVVAGHADDALDAIGTVGDGDAVEDEVADAQTAAAVASVGHVVGNPDAVDGKGGQHGGTRGGRDLEDVRDEEVRAAEELEDREGEADRVGVEVGYHDG